MKTVLLAAAGSLFLAFAANAADLPHPAVPEVSRALPPGSVSGAACIDGAAVTPTAFSTDEDAESDASTCSRFLSTQTLIQPPALGRT